MIDNTSAFVLESLHIVIDKGRMDTCIDRIAGSASGNAAVWKHCCIA